MYKEARLHLGTVGMSMLLSMHITRLGGDSKTRILCKTIQQHTERIFWTVPYRLASEHR